MDSFLDIYSNKQFNHVTEHEINNHLKLETPRNLNSRKEIIFNLEIFRMVLATGYLPKIHTRLRSM